MLRILIIWVGTYAVYNTDLDSEDILKSIVFPIINVLYLIFLLINFLEFLNALAANASKRRDVNIIDLAYEVSSLLYEELSHKYVGKFSFLGSYSSIAVDIAVPIEIILVVFSFYQELQLLAHLAS
jgi:uncharacterized membrane protein